MTAPGIPSDDLPDVLATGRTDVTTAFVSMSARDPDGGDAAYLEWHAMDHAPEQHRLAALRWAHRLVSTPECRRARLASSERYDAVDHVMTYAFAGADGLGPFGALGRALGAGGRMPLRLPSVELGRYELVGTAAAPRILAGADVVPWRPARGGFVLVERGAVAPATLVEVEGVAGVWWFTGVDGSPGLADTGDLQLALCFLDDDPVEVAGRLAPVLDGRWSSGAVAPLLAAPFHGVVARDWGRHLP